MRGMPRKSTVGVRLADSWTWLLQVHFVMGVFWSNVPQQKAPMLASLSWNGSKGKSLKEYRGEGWFRAK